VTHTKIRSKLVVIVTAGSQKITLWGHQRTPLGILRDMHWGWPTVRLHFPLQQRSSCTIPPRPKCIHFF